MIKRVVLVGGLSKDGEFRTSESGIDVGSLRVAVNGNLTKGQGEGEGDFIN
uniref:single-stranded DNA-binding protein n=1 Tax=Staphylococcus epidermidis TaxID=1282 RepID=UPI00119CF7A2